MVKENQRKRTQSDLFTEKLTRPILDAVLKEFRTDADEISKESNSSLFTAGLKKYAISGNRFIPMGESTNKIPAGWYKSVWTQSGYIFQLISVKNEELIKLPIPEIDSVLTDMDKFWKSEADYRKYGFSYKRGILLYGIQGTGKSGIIRLVADELIKKDGIIFNIEGPDDIFSFDSLFAQLREIEPDRKVICVMEDIDNFIRYGGSATSKLLNVLDGNLKFDNIVFLASTNFPEILLSSLVNRPSRFDRKYEIGAPDAKAREFYVRTKFKQLPDEEVKKIVTATEGFVIDLLKELVVSVYVLKYDFDFVIAELKKNFKFGDAVKQDSFIEAELLKDSFNERDEFTKDIE